MVKTPKKKHKKKKQKHRSRSRSASSLEDEASKLLPSTSKLVKQEEAEVIEKPSEASFIVEKLIKKLYSETN